MHTPCTFPRMAVYLGLILAMALHVPPAVGDTGAPISESRYTVDHDLSWLRIYVYRAGLLSRLGHDHLISTAALAGDLTYVPPPSMAAAFTLHIPVASLVVDDPEQRQAVGGKFAGPVAAEDREGTRHNMLSGKVLDAERYPVIEIGGRWLDGNPTHGTVAVGVRLRGAERRLTVPVDIHRDGDRLQVTGHVHVLQTDFDIVPLSVLGGMLQVADGMDVHFSLVFVPSAGIE